jgi:hypothetical protein
MARRGGRNVDEVLLKALACGATVEAAVRTAGVGEATVYRRKRDPKFNRRLQELKTEMALRTASMLNAIGTESVKNLMALQKESVPYATRLGAVRAALELGLRYRVEGELEQRLAALETLLEGQKKPASRIIVPGES